MMEAQEDTLLFPSRGSPDNGYSDVLLAPLPGHFTRRPR